MKLLIAPMALILSSASPALFAQTISTGPETTTGETEIIVEHTNEPDRIVEAPDVIYVEEDDGTVYRSTRSVTLSDDGCYFDEAHQHIHCDDETTVTTTTRPVTVVHEHRHYNTRRYHDPISTGVGIGIAVGVPLLIHESYRHNRRHYSSYYNSWNHGGRYDRGRYYRGNGNHGKSGHGGRGRH